MAGRMVGVDDRHTSVNSHAEVSLVTVLGHYITDLTRCWRLCHRPPGSKSADGYG